MAAGNLIAGPWGGQGGGPWSYLPSGAISHITITYDTFINTIQFTSQDASGKTELSSQFGVTVGSNRAEIIIDTQAEKLSGISGTYGTVNNLLVVTSLSFTTDLNKSYGPFGIANGTAFSYSVNDESIVGFHGRSGLFLDSIGLYIRPSNDSVGGPWGGQGGGAWTYFPHGVITHITITYTDVIHTIQFISQDASGKTTLSAQHGIEVGSKKAEFDIDAKVETLISISGTYGAYQGLQVVTSLSFTTSSNKIYGPFGTANVSDASFKSKEETIVGFQGRSGTRLDAIGIYHKPAEGLVAGPWGGVGGGPWSYLPNGAIIHISITYSQVINTIQFTSRDESGKTELSPQFGIQVGSGKAEIDINTQIENLNGISGTYGVYNGLQLVTSLSFTTSSNKSYGPIGLAKVSDLSFSFKSDKIITGFHGRCGSLLDAIGVYLKRKTISVGLWGNQEPENRWAYETKGVISNISITHEDDVVHTIRFTSQDDLGNVNHSDTFGWTSGSKSDEIVIDIKNEKLNNISGTVGVTRGYVSITSLTFSTDTKKVFGPFGTPSGTAFSLLAKDEGFIGFYGRSGEWLDAIGVYLKPIIQQRFGQWGNQEPGNDWSYVPKGAISHISLTHDDAINTIKFTSQDDQGLIDQSPTFGWTTGTIASEFSIDVKKEKLTKISGTIDMKSGYVVVTSLSFATEKNSVFGPFGTARGTTFSAPVSNGFFSGFYGRSGYWLDAIAVVVKPIE